MAVGREGARKRTVLVAHPGAELYGSDRVMLESVSGFVDDGWQVVTTLPHGGPLVAELESRGTGVAFVPTPVLRKSALRPRGAVRLIRDTVAGTVQGLRLLRRTRPQAVYVSTVTIPLWSLLGRLTGRPVLVHVHEAEGSASALTRRVLAFPLLLASGLVVNSSFSVDVLRRSISRLTRRATVVYNGVPGPTELVPPRDALTGPVRLVYVGRLSPRKGVDVAVEAVRLLVADGCPATLDVVGAVFPGYEWYQEQLRTQIADGGLQESVRLCGFHPDVWSYLATNDVALVPSRVDEPFGNTAVEAVLAARPVVVSATSGLREAAAGYASAQYVTPGDPRALADAVLAVRDRWSEFRDAAVADAGTAARRHSPEGYRGQVAELLGALTATR